MLDASELETQSIVLKPYDDNFNFMEYLIIQTKYDNLMTLFELKQFNILLILIAPASLSILLALLKI